MTASYRRNLATTMACAAIIAGITFAVLPTSAQAITLAGASGAVAPHGLVEKARVTINVNTHRGRHWNRRHHRRHHCWWNGRRRVCGWR
jgi:hypothetical protein